MLNDNIALVTFVGSSPSKYLILCFVLFLTAQVVIVWRNDRPPLHRRLPAYELVWQGGAPCNLCGEVAAVAVPQLSPRTILSILLRPQHKVSPMTPLFLSAFIVAGEQVTPWAVKLERAPEGGLFLQGTTAELLDLPPGRYELAFMLGSAQPLPEHPGDIQRVKQAAARQGWQLLSQPIDIVAQ